LVASTSRHCSSDIRIATPSRVMPAFATITSTGPNSSTAAFTAAFTCSESATSTANDFAHPSGAFAERENATTVSPSAMKYSAMAAPMPRLAPVTMT
jgi:hypothetical protein